MQFGFGCALGGVRAAFGSCEQSAISMEQDVNIVAGASGHVCSGVITGFHGSSCLPSALFSITGRMDEGTGISRIIFRGSDLHADKI